jgi:hypothetical protein
MRNYSIHIWAINERKREHDQVTKVLSNKAHTSRKTRDGGKTTVIDAKAQAATEPSDTSFKLFEELANVPARVIQLDSVYVVVTQCSEKRNLDQLPLLTWLFSAIASPNVFLTLSATFYKSPNRKLA